ncbi:MAG TPA: hypothetical protein VFB32_15470 [Rudaea sp.]|nr:hypothetical protein [Rudaea sp.]
MVPGVSVCDRQFSGQIQQVLQSLRRAGCHKANTLYILTPSELIAAGLSLHMLKVLGSIGIRSAAVAVGAGESAPTARLVMRLLEDKASHDVAFKLGADLLS